MLGMWKTWTHVCRDCTKLQARGKFAYIVGSHQTSDNDPKSLSSDEDDVKSFVDEDYEKGSYEMQALMVRGR